jgi:acyl-CoA hydrolase
VWTTPFDQEKATTKVGDGLFVFVAIDEQGKPRQLPPARD